MDECAAQCEFQVMPIIGAKAPNYITGECIVGLARHKQYGAARGVAAEQRALRSLEHRSEEHTSELQSLMRISYAIFCLKNKKKSDISSILRIYSVIY